MNYFKSFINSLQLFGIDFIKIWKNIIGIPRFFNNYLKYKKQTRNNNLFPVKKFFPILTEWYESAGDANSHYFIQDLFVAQLIFKANPERHIDIGSRIDGFVSNIASFRNIEILDIRELKTTVDNIKFTKADLMEVPLDLMDSCDSISSLHALEHFGLGRYGDNIDAFGFLKGIDSIYQILRTDGIFYFSVPIGSQRVEFNAHRVFSISYLVKIFEKRFKIVSFSYINDKGDFFKFYNLTNYEIQNSCNCLYGCGIFVLKKINE